VPCFSFSILAEPTTATWSPTGSGHNAVAPPGKTFIRKEYHLDVSSASWLLGEEGNGKMKKVTPLAPAPKNKAFVPSSVNSTAERVTPTAGQLELLSQAVSRLRETADEIRDLLQTIYGEADPTSQRSFQTLAAVQRLQWEIQRKSSGAKSATA
jgi:hypothetical protein